MLFTIGDKVVNRHTEEILTVISVDDGLVLQRNNGDVSHYCAFAFKKQTLSRSDISGIKKSLREYTR